MENYFILLELSFDPPVNDPKIIETAISRKQSQWSMDMVNPIKKAKASEYMTHIGEMKAVMLDDKKRLHEASEAKKIREEKRKDLDAKLRICHAKGDALSERDLRVLIKLFGPYGFSESDIQKSFNADGGEEQKIDPAKVLDKNIAGSIKNYLKQLDFSGKSIYQFLGVDANSSAQQVKEAADALKGKLLAKGDKSGRDNATMSLCDLISNIFKDKEGKLKYDKYYNLTKYDAVCSSADELALGNRRRIEPRMKESLIEIAVSQYHISVSDASVYINNYCSFMGYLLPENKIICGLCGAENPSGSTNCVKCGKPLIIVCPSCGSENNNSAKSCAKCGFDLTKMGEAVELIAEARQQYAVKAFDEADRLLKQAEAFWPNHPDITGLKNTIDSERKAVSETIGSIMKAIQEKRFYSARTQINQVRARGFTVDQEVSSSVNGILEKVEKGLSLMRSQTGDAAFQTAVALRADVEDCEELNSQLKNFPPMQPAGVTIRRNGNTIVLSWTRSPSVGNITYVLIRKIGSFSNNISDGTVIYQGNDLSFSDSSAPAYSVLCYSVFAIRLGICSIAVKASETEAIVEPVADLRAVGGDGLVALSWTVSEKIGSIRLWKYHGENQPAGLDAFEPVQCSRMDGIMVEGLENKAVYWFAVCAVFSMNSSLYYSEPAMICAVPEKPAKPLENFHITLEDEIFRASWNLSEWDAILFYSLKKPDYSIGTIYSLQELLKQYKKININRRSLTEAEFHMSFVGACYIIPGVISASNVILNTAVYLSSVPDVREITFDLSAGEMYVNFAWPKGVVNSLLVYRMDKYPENPGDPAAVKVECSKKQYEGNEGILISDPPKGTIHAKIYTYFDSEGRRIYSEGVEALMSNEPQRDAFYSFSYSKPGIFNKKSVLNLQIQVSGKCVFPGFAVIAKYQSTPLNRSDGDNLAGVSVGTEIVSDISFDFDVPKLRPGTRLKLFFLNDKNYRLFRIQCKSGSQI